MAKIRRIIRKLRPPRYQPIDEQLWPVIVALLLLGGFTLGAVLAYLRFDDPRWYANALTWLIIALLLTGGATVALTLVDNRAFRRSMQLAILLGLLFHVILLVVSFELTIFGRIYDLIVAKSDMTENRQPTVVPEYFQSARRPQPRRELERPVETETPEPPPDEQRPPETQPEERAPELQPTPVPEPEQTATPTLVLLAPLGLVLLQPRLLERALNWGLAELGRA